MVWWIAVEWREFVAERASGADAQENKSGVSLFSGVANEGNFWRNLSAVQSIQGSYAYG